MLRGSGISVSPSFNSYTSTHLADIAARVGQEYLLQSDSDYDADFLDSISPIDASNPSEQLRIELPPSEEETSDDEDDDEFEFPSLSREPDGSPITAGDMSYRGQAAPVFPLFNRDLLFSDARAEDSKPREPDPPPPPTRFSLGRLFMEDRDPPSCSFSSSEDELNGVPDGTYCVWTPEAAEAKAEASRRRCKKSDSMGSSRRWKFLDLFQSHSDSSRRDLLVFLPPVIASGWKKNKDAKVELKSDDSTATATARAMHRSKSSSGRVAAVALKAKEANGADTTNPASEKEHTAKVVGSRGRSLLPYKEELLGFLSNSNGPSRNVHAF